MSEVDVAFRRARAALRQMEIRLTGQEWARDVAHRGGCTLGGPTECDDVAHHYGRALEEGRVYVDGKQVIEVEGRWTIRG